MNSSKVCRPWVNMLRTLEADLIIPRHGRPFVIPATVQRFLDWFDTVDCGIDRLTQQAYRVA